MPEAERKGENEEKATDRKRRNCRASRVSETDDIKHLPTMIDVPSIYAKCELSSEAQRRTHWKEKE